MLESTGGFAEQDGVLLNFHAVFFTALSFIAANRKMSSF
jgi:hypothetical protein